jgi:hypothetical protein
MVYNTWSHWVSGILNTRKTVFQLGEDQFPETLCYSKRWVESRMPVIPNVIHHGQNVRRIQESLEMLELVVARADDPWDVEATMSPI